MPTYEYRCTEGHEFEQVQKMSELPVRVCPACGAAAERAISGGAGLIFKGSGFYITDYGKDGKGARKDSDTSSPVEAKSDSKPESKSDAKPDGKAPSKSDGASAPAAPKPETKTTPKADPS